MGRWVVLFLYFSLFLAFPRCNYNPTTLEADTVIGDNPDGLQRLEQVSGISLVTPSSSPNISTTPTIRITGLRSKDTVYIYSDSNCSSLLTTGASTGASTDVTLPSLSAGIHTIYVKRRWDSENIESDCSTVPLIYEVLAPTCSDGILNGSETDTDCGGGDCTSCLLGSTCTIDSDCATENCTGSVCQSPRYLGDGSDGALIIAADTDFDRGQPLTASVSSGVSIISVSDSSGFSVGDEILVIQMQGDSVNTGNYEFAHIAAISSPNLTLTEPLTNDYNSSAEGGVFNTNIVRVPQYTSVTINPGMTLSAPAWDGSSGGVIVFRASGTVTINGSISASAKGLRGGIAISGWPKTSESGEGPTTDRQAVRSQLTGAGSGAIHENVGYGGSGAGGGGYGTAGDNGLQGTCLVDDVWGYGGSTYGQPDLSQIFLGSGGGSGLNSNVNHGGAGGGIIIINALSVTSGTIEAGGEAGLMPNTSEWTSGGGSGGSIYINAATIESSANFSAQGGAGGVALSNGCLPTAEGGDGGDGRIRLNFTTNTGTSDPASANYSLAQNF